MTKAVNLAAFGSDVVAPTGDAPIYSCRAWVNFNGTGTVAIRASGNVSSLTDNGTGNYTVNFSTAMPDTNFCAVSDCNQTAGSVGSADLSQVYSRAVGSCSVMTEGDPAAGSTRTDMETVSVSVFR